jgi:hypothetical protein
MESERILPAVIESQDLLLCNVDMAGLVELYNPGDAESASISIWEVKLLACDSANEGVTGVVASIGELKRDFSRLEEIFGEDLTCRFNLS